MGMPVGGIAIAAPGLVEHPSGILRAAPNLGWRDLDLAEDLRQRIDLCGLPVTTGNEADFAASAELFGGRPELRDFIHVSGEVGIGGGIIIGGEIFRGVRGYAGEIGHLCVDPSGPRCRCGARGCLERLAGQEQILTAAGIDDAHENGDVTTKTALHTLLSRLYAGDTRATAAVTAAGNTLGTGLAAVVNAVDVPAIVLGGTYAELQPWLEAPLREEIDRRVISATWSPIAVFRSCLASEAAVRGAGAAAVTAILDDPEPYVATRVQADTRAH